MSDVLDRIERTRIVPVVALDDEETAEPLAGTLLKAGLNVVEITFRTSAAAPSIRRIASRFPEMMTGAGTVLQPDQVRQAVDAGAQFIVAPGLSLRVLEAAGAAGAVMIPGVMTPSEIEAALGLELRVLKFFPAEQAGGAAMIKALEGPYGHTRVRFIPTGGIHAANMMAYLERPSVIAVGGSWMVERKLIQAADWRQVEQLTRAAVSAAHSLRRHSA